VGVELNSLCAAAADIRTATGCTALVENVGREAASHPAAMRTSTSESEFKRVRMGHLCSLHRLLEPDYRLRAGETGGQCCRQGQCHQTPKCLKCNVLLLAAVQTAQAAGGGCCWLLGVYTCHVVYNYNR
jgi:hypothetical protein